MEFLSDQTKFDFGMWYKICSIARLSVPLKCEYQDLLRFNKSIILKSEDGFLSSVNDIFFEVYA